jgi:large subunit ribosomal protein L32
MPVPKRKRSRTRRDKRFANKGMKVQAITECSHCHVPLTPHTICRHCGHYKGKKIISTKLDRLVKRAELKRAKKSSQSHDTAQSMVSE